MSFASPPRKDLSPDDALPPVTPPSAGFIVQLFVVPGVIVIVVVTIWVMFNWLAQMGNDRDAFVRALNRNNEARWQAAFNLATALRAEQGSRSPQLTVDPELAQELAKILDREIDAGSMDRNPISLRIWLCRALGAFKVSDGLPTLIKAATVQRSDDEADVRRAALEGIALLADHVGASDPQFADNPQLKDALLAATQDSDPRTRSAAAVAIGVIGGPTFVEVLDRLLEDTNPDVRYNAATRLAHLGDVASVSVLAEMLDLDQVAGVELEKEKELQPFKRVLITINGLRATSQLAEKNPEADLSSLADGVQKLLAGDINAEVRIDATSVLRQLKSRTAEARP
jgi:HEAT repeat protein